LCHTKTPANPDDRVLGRCPIGVNKLKSEEADQLGRHLDVFRASHQPKVFAEMGRKKVRPLGKKWKKRTQLAQTCTPRGKQKKEKQLSKAESNTPRGSAIIGEASMRAWISAKGEDN